MAPRCATSAFPTTVEHGVTSAAPASSGHPLAVSPATAVATQILKVPSSFVIPKLATASAASTTRRGPSASCARQASSVTPQLITAHGQVSCASDFNILGFYFCLIFLQLLSLSSLKTPHCEHCLYLSQKAIRWGYNNNKIYGSLYKSLVKQL